jgi:hypothetical protein
LRRLCGSGRKKVVAIEVKGAGAERAGGVGKEVRKNGQAEAEEEAQVVVGRQEAVVGIEAKEILEGRGHHGVGPCGKLQKYFLVHCIRTCTILSSTGLCTVYI